MKKYVGLDTESRGGGHFGRLTHVYCASVCELDSNTKKRSSYALPLFWDVSQPIESNPFAENYLALQQLCDDNVIILHNAAHDLDVLDQMGITVTDWEDSMLLSYCACANMDEVHVKGGGLQRHSLGAWGTRLGYPKLKVTEDWEELHAELIPLCQSADTSFVLEEAGELLEYAVVDAELAYRVYHMIMHDISDKALEIYTNVDKPYISIIREMTMNGMYVDLDKLVELQSVWGGELSKAVAEAKEIVGQVPVKKKKMVNPVNCEGYIFTGMEEDPKKPERMLFTYDVMGEYNPNSKDQTAYALTELYGWVPEKFTDTKKPAVDYDVLSKLTYPLADPLLRIAEFSKLVGTYAIPMHRTASETGGFIYPSWNQCITITGRLSCSQPNFQNIPTRTEKGQELRKSVIAPPGYLLSGIDLQAIEYRVLASLMAQHFMDTVGYIPDDVQFMVDTFNNGIDIHTAMAELWFGGKPDYVGSEKRYRSMGKNISYGNMFGFGADKASVMMGVSKDEAQELIDIANQNNPSLPEFKQSVWDSYKSNNGVGYSLYGRPFVYPDILLPEKGKQKWKLYRAQRQAFNARIQGTAADILKLLQMYVWSNICDDYEAVQIGSIHDETLYLLPADNAAAFCADVTKHYRNSTSYLPYVTIDGSCHSGSNWYAVK